MCDSQKAVNTSTPRATRHRRNLTHQTALADARWPHHTDHSAMAIDCAVQQALDGGHLPPPTDQIRLSTPDGVMPFAHAQQAMGGHWLLGTLDANHLWLTESRCAIDESRGRRAQHHPAGRSDRLHPLSHPDLLADGGVTERPRTDLTSDHLTRVQADPQLQLDTVAVLDVDGKPLRFLLNAQGRQAGTNSVVLQCHRRTEHRHDAVAGELATVPPYRCTTTAARLTNSAMISRSRSAPTAAAMSIE